MFLHKNASFLYRLCRFPDEYNIFCPEYTKFCKMPDLNTNNTLDENIWLRYNI